MALSNIFNEPRREITETVVGLAMSAPIIAADCWFANMLGNTADSHSPPYWALFVLGLLLGLVALLMGGVIIYVIAGAIHSIGEAVCNILETRFNIRLRPAR